MKNLIILFVVVVSAQTGFGQTAETIRTGRPGQAIGPFVVGEGLFQIQSGIDYESAKTPGTTNTVTKSNNVVRLGLSESFEVSTVFDYQNQELSTAGTTRGIDGVSNFQLGFRYNFLSEPRGWLPGIGFQTRFRLKQVSSEYQRDEVAPVFLLVLNHRLCDTLTLNTNAGMAYNGMDATPTYNYVFSLSQSFGEDWSVVYEFYGNEYAETGSSYLGFGAGYLVNKDFQLDVYASTGDNNGVEELYATVGISWRTLVF